MNLRRLATLSAFLVCTALQAQTAAPAPVSPPSDGLFDALGGKPGIAALIDDFVPRVATDGSIGRFFKDTNLKELNKQLRDQICVVSGGPCVYEGAAMKASHADLGIGKSDFNRMVEVLQDAMDARGIAFADQNRLLARLAPMHRDVITSR